MSFMGGFGALLGGATEEAGKIHAERFQKEEANRRLATSMLQHIIDNPNLDEASKAQAQQAWRDLLMETTFPKQFKRGNKNPVRKLIDQFIGLQDSGQAVSKALEQSGVGTGNAKTQLGTTIPPMPQPPPGVHEPGAVAGPGAIPEMPPDPNTVFGVAPPESVGGFRDPADVALYGQARAAQLAERVSSAQSQQELEDKLKVIDVMQKDPRFEEMRKSGLMSELLYKIIAGASPVGSTRGAEGNAIPIEQASAIAGRDLAKELGGATHAQPVYNARNQSDPKTWDWLPAMPSYITEGPLSQRLQQALFAEASRRGLTVDEFKQQFPQEASDVMSQVASPNRTSANERIVPRPDGGFDVITTYGGTAYQRPGGTPVTPQLPNALPDGGRDPRLDYIGKTPSEQKTASLGVLSSTYSRLEDLDKLLATAKPNKMGAIMGRLGNIQAHALGGFLMDEDVQTLAIALDQALAEQVFGKGGKQLTLTEISTYSKFFSQLQQGLDFAKKANQANLVETRRQMDSILRTIPKVSRTAVDPLFKEQAGFTEDDTDSGDILQEFEEFLKTPPK